MIGGGKHKGSTSASGQQSWHTLAGGRSGVGVQSPQARKRRHVQMLKLLGIFAIFVAIVAAITWGVMAIKNRQEPIQIATPSKPVDTIIFDTDGVLPSRWLGTVIELRRDTNMM